MESPIDRETYEKAMKQYHEAARERSVDKAMEEHKLDLIALSMDSACLQVAAAAIRPAWTCAATFTWTNKC